MTKTGLILFLAGCFVVTTELSAQEEVIKSESIHWGVYRPGDVVAARMHAHADQMRSFGYGASKYGDFLIKREKSISMDLDNKLKRLEYYFEAKRINRAYREETHYDVRERQMLSNSRIWQQAKSLPELTNKTSGKAQNFLLHRLSSTVLSFQFASEQGLLNDEAWLAHLQLDPAVYDHLWLMQGETKFAATRGQSLDVSWWPYVLRAPEYEALRNDLIEIRNQIAAGETPEISFEELQQLGDAHQQLADALNEGWQIARVDVETAGKSRLAVEERNQWRRAFQYLDGLYLEIRKLKQSGSRELLTGEMRFDPHSASPNFITFLNFIQRNGLEFAPATKAPESIAAYNTAFQLMRDLYVLAADDDSAVIDPKKDGKSR